MSYVGAETVVAEDWVLSSLSANSTIASLVQNPDHSFRIYESLAPHALGDGNDQIQYPFVLYQTQAAPDTYGIGPKSRIMTLAMLIVRGVAESTYDALVPLANAIDAVLDGAQANLSNGTILGVRRDGQYRMTEEFEGRVVRHLGGQYTVYVKA